MTPRVLPGMKVKLSNAGKAALRTHLGHGVVIKTIQPGRYTVKFAKRSIRDLTDRMIKVLDTQENRDIWESAEVERALGGEKFKFNMHPAQERFFNSRGHEIP